MWINVIYWEIKYNSVHFPVFGSPWIHTTHVEYIQYQPHNDVSVMKNRNIMFI